MEETVLIYSLTGFSYRICLLWSDFCPWGEGANTYIFAKQNTSWEGAILIRKTATGKEIRVPSSV